MDPLASVLLSAALSLPPPYRSTEPADAYRARLGVIAEAIALESKAATEWPWDPHSAAFATLSTFYEESTFARDVHDGRRTGDEGRAVCLGSIHATRIVPRAEWRTLTGSDLEATRRCARATLRVLSVHAQRCAPGVPEATHWALSRTFSGYATGYRCKPIELSERRARRTIRLLETWSPDGTTVSR